MGAIEHAWALQRRWSIVATERGKELDRRRLANLSLLVAGAVLGGFAAVGLDDTVSRVVAAATSVTLAAAALVQRGLTSSAVEQQTVARATSEGIKADVYRYLVGVPPYDGDDRDQRLDVNLDALEERAAAHLVALNGVEPDVKVLPQVDGLDDYVEERARDQQAWHKDRRASHAARADTFRRAELGFTIVAALLTATGSIIGEASVAGFVGVATTAAAVISSHLAAAGHDRIAAQYAATSERLERLIARLPDDRSDEEATAFVESVEEVLARQNESWVGIFNRHGG